MKTKSLLALTIGGLLCGLCLYAADVWNSKEPADWSETDVRKVLNDSPWAKQVAVNFQGRPMGEGLPSGRGGRGGGGMGGGGGIESPGGGGGRGGRGSGGMEGGEGGQRPEINVTVRWESAVPIQLAQKHLPTEEAAIPADQYVILLSGLPMRGAGGQRTPQQFEFQEGTATTGRPTRDPAAVREEFMERTQLIRKGKPAIHPSDIKMETNNTRQIRFFFPRGEDPISLDDKEVTFTTQIGMMKVEKKFRVKEMTFKGKLEI